jgi:CcmD family protein
MSTISWAQDKVEMADVMRRDGKIYTVVAVCLTILIGLFIYVFLIDRKINKLEKEQQQ